MKTAYSVKIDSKKLGFTMVELMYATVLSSVLMVAVGGLAVGYWRTAQGFMTEQQKMQEIAILAKVFTDNARALPSVNISGSSAVSSGTEEVDASKGVGIRFLNETPVEIIYDGTDSVSYDPDAGDNSNALIPLLEHSVVDNAFTIVPGGRDVKLSVTVYEDDVGKTNAYRINAAPRNYSNN